jgi:hypothetical protein
MFMLIPSIARVTSARHVLVSLAARAMIGREDSSEFVALHCPRLRPDEGAGGAVRRRNLISKAKNQFDSL